MASSSSACARATAALLFEYSSASRPSAAASASSASDCSQAAVEMDAAFFVIDGCSAAAAALDAFDASVGHGVLRGTAGSDGKEAACASLGERKSACVVVHFPAGLSSTSPNQAASCLEKASLNCTGLTGES
jgi:hypothetical protein